MDAKDPNLIRMQNHCFHCNDKATRLQGQLFSDGVVRYICMHCFRMVDQKDVPRLLRPDPDTTGGESTFTVEHLTWNEADHLLEYHRLAQMAAHAEVQAAQHDLERETAELRELMAARKGSSK